MALTIPEALKAMGMAGNPRTAAFLKAMVTVDALFARIPFIETNQLMIPVPREGNEPTGGNFIADDHSSSIEESTGTDDMVGVQLRRVVGDMDIDSLVDDFDPSQRQRHLEKKVKATARKVAGKVITGGHTTGFTAVGTAGVALALETVGATFAPWMDSKRKGPGSIKYTHAGTFWQFRAPGDLEYGPQVAVAADGFATLYSGNKSNWIRVNIDVSDAVADGEVLVYFTTTTNEFDGLPKIISPAQTIDPVGADGDLFSFAVLDKMISNLKVGDSPAFVMSGDFIELYLALHRALGGTQPQTLMLEGYGQAVPTYRGIPILRNDNIATDETVGASQTASLYLASMDAEDGLALAAANLGTRFDPMTDPARGPVLGWRVENIGALAATDRRRTRLAWYGAPVLKSPLAAVRRRGVRAAIS